METDSGYPYNFPFKPYPIQEELMKKIEKTLEEKKIGIFSSPTGTGKSLSIICSTLYFIEKLLEKEEEAVKSKMCEAKTAIDEIENSGQDWVTSHSKKREVNERIMDIKTELERFEKFHQRNRQIREFIQSRLSSKSESERTGKRSKKHKPGILLLLYDFFLISSTSLFILEDENDTETSVELKDDYLIGDQSDDELDESKENVEDEPDQIKPKIIYSSRTHSQLAQFVSEIKKTVYNKRIRVVSLGSRANLCVNPSVINSKSTNLINDKCLEMQRSKSSKCAFLKKPNMEEIRDEILGLVLDIEEAQKLGCTSKACSYYASRMAVREAQVLVVPYNILIHRQTRESFGISLEDNIVVIDEAHNLLDTIASIYGVQVTGGQIIDSFSQLNQYMIRYSRRLTPSNLMMIKQLQFILSCFVKLFKDKPLKNNGQYELFSPTELLIRIGAEEFNVFQLLNFCEKSQIARKLFGFSTVSSLDNNPAQDTDQTKTATGTLAFLAKLQAEKKGAKKPKKLPKKKVEITSVPVNQEPKSLSSPLYQVMELFRCLTSPQGEGRILWTHSNEDIRLSTLKFILLDPAYQFKEVVEKSRSLVLIGGTMEPVSEFVDLLFTPLGITQEKLVNYSCDHVIPDKNILPLCLGRGPRAKVRLNNFDFLNRMILLTERPGVYI